MEPFDGIYFGRITIDGEPTDCYCGEAEVPCTVEDCDGVMLQSVRGWVCDVCSVHMTIHDRIVAGITTMRAKLKARGFKGCYQFSYVTPEEWGHITTDDWNAAVIDPYADLEDRIMASAIPTTAVDPGPADDEPKQPFFTGSQRQSKRRGW